MTIDRPKQTFNVQVIILLVQLVIFGFGWWVRTELMELHEHSALIHEDQERRLRYLEAFAAAGDRWTRTDHYEFETKLAGQLEAMRTDLALIKRELGIKK